MSSPRRLLVLGATGPTGRHIVSQALEQGHHVTAVSRHANALELSHPNLVKAVADVTGDASRMADLVGGNDAVVSSLGIGKSFSPRSLMALSAPAIVGAMKRCGSRRLVFISAFGVGGTAPDAPLVFRLMFRTVLRAVYADKALGEAAVRESGLDWTILAPVLLTDAPATGHYRLEPAALGGPWKVSRADVASAALACLDEPVTIGRRLVVAP